jgi:DNA-binding MarR family transcriptional regulator
MSTDAGAGLSTDDAIRAMLQLMPRVVARIKRIPLPEALRSLNLTPRHLSLLSSLLFDGEMTVNELATRLDVAPTTVSFMVGELNRRGVVERSIDPADRRRAIIAITDEPEIRAAVEGWLANGARAWRAAFEPLTPEQRRTFVQTLEAYERESTH